MFPSRTNNIQDDELENVLEHCYPIYIYDNPVKLPSFMRPDTNILNGFVFYFKKGRKIGVVLQFYIHPTANSFVGQHYDLSYPFCVCLLSDCPDISSHFSFLSEVIDPIVGKTILPQPTNFVISKDLLNQTGNCIKSLLIKEDSPYIALSEHASSMNFLLPKLDKYYTSNHHTIFNQSIQLLYQIFQTLLSSLSIEQIVKLALAFLCEYHILFISEDLTKTSFCVLALTNLLNNINHDIYVHPYLTLKSEYSLEQPPPFVAGVYRARFSVDICVNLDECKISYKNNKINHEINNIICKIPYFKKLVTQAEILLQNPSIIKIPQELIKNSKLIPNEFIDHFKKANKTIHPNCFQYFVKTNYILSIEFISKFSNLFTNPFFPKLMDFAQGCLVTNLSDQPNTVLDEKMLISRVEKVYQPFIGLFSNTTIFTNFKYKVEDIAEMSKSQVEIFKRKNAEIFAKNKKDIELILKKKSPERRLSYQKINDENLLPK